MKDTYNNFVNYEDKGIRYNGMSFSKRRGNNYYYFTFGYQPKYNNSYWNSGKQYVVYITRSQSNTKPTRWYFSIRKYLKKNNSHVEKVRGYGTLDDVLERISQYYENSAN